MIYGEKLSAEKYSDNKSEGDRSFYIHRSNYGVYRDDIYYIKGSKFYITLIHVIKLN